VARLEIEEALNEPASGASIAAPRVGRDSKWRAPLFWATTGGAVATFAMVMLARGTGPTERPETIVAASVLVGDSPLGLAAPGIHFAVAPDGKSVIFPGRYGSTHVLFRRDLDRLDPEPIVGTTGGSDLFFSDDGRSIGFETRSELWTTPLDGGTPQRLLPNLPLRGGTWEKGGRIVVGRVGSGLWTASISGGEPRQLTVPRQGERHELPQLLPGGAVVLFTIIPPNGPAQVGVHLLESGETRTLFEGIGARFVDTGHVVFGRQGKVWAVAFDPETLQTRGVARQVRDDVVWSAAGYPQFTIGGGLLAYVRHSEASAKVGKSVPVLMDRRGNEEVLRLGPDNYMLPRFSPSGDRFAIQVGAARDLWVYDLRLGTSTKLTADRIIAYSAPAWTPDGSRLVFTTWFDSEVGLGWLSADGSGTSEPLLRGVDMRSYERTHPVLLPDGSGVIMTGLVPGASVEDLLLARLSGEKRLDTLFHAPGVERNPAIAPDGRFVAYNSDDSGRAEVSVRPFPNVRARRWQISSAGGAYPVWTRGGREIVYKDAQGRIMSVAVRADDANAFDFSEPVPLFTVRADPDCCFGIDRGFDVASDGERFLFLRAADGTTSTPDLELVLIGHWAEELKGLVPRER
jgi:eukaryotic-like serine/threonine-protein kinase